MASNNDEIKQITSPGFLSAVYFALLAVVATIFIKGTWYLIDMKQFIPVFQAMMLGAAVAASFGALFGRAIIFCKKPYKFKSFLSGLAMALCAFPVYVLFYALLIHWNNPSFFMNNDLSSPLMMYAFIFIYSFFTAGWWLILLAALAAMVLRGYFVYSVLHANEIDSP